MTQFCCDIPIDLVSYAFPMVFHPVPSHKNSRQGWSRWALRHDLGMDGSRDGARGAEGASGSAVVVESGASQW